MNLRQPYEQLIADKLRKLPAPDADASWQQMKRLLDDDEDTRPGGGKRPPGRGGGWRMGAIAIILLTSLWLYVEKTTVPGTLAKNNTTAPSTGNQPVVKADKKTSGNIPGNNQTATIDNTTTLQNTTAAVTVRRNTSTGTATVDKPANTQHHAAAGGNSIDTKGNNLLPEQSNPEKGFGMVKNHSGDRYNAAADPATGKNPYQRNKRITAGLSSNNHFIADNQKAGTAGGDILYPAAEPPGKINNRAGKTGDNYNRQAGNSTAGSYAPLNQAAAVEESNWFDRLNQLKVPAANPVANTLLLAGDSIENKRSSTGLLNSETKKLVAKAQRDKAIEDLTRKEKKSFHLNLSNVFKPFSLHMDAEPRWAAGVALNSGITLNAQNRFNYNMNAKSGTLSDYIPSVYLQFHLNDYVYMQTELNFISPQYTPQLLVYQQNNDVTAQPGASRQKSIYVQKLYYFNLPLSLHYSPINNLYFSAGLQFSSFQSGLASIQEKQYTTLNGPDHPSSFSNSILKFKDDSIAAKLAPNEWRWQAGADYYWNRFTAGLRYNRAFKDLLNVNVSTSLPPTTMRNESLIFFIRYNLFESRKKGSNLF